MKTPSAPCCPIAYGLALFGDRWSLLILRDMMLHAKQHYNDFLGAPEGISTNILASRLKQLVANGFIEKHLSPTDKKRAVYILSERGISLLPVIFAMMDWAHKQGEPIVLSANMLATLAQDRDALVATASARLLAQREQQLALVSR